MGIQFVTNELMGQYHAIVKQRSYRSYLQTVSDKKGFE